MRRIVAFATLMVVWTLANGQAMTLADAKAKGAVQVSAADLKALLAGAKVVNQSPTGSTRSWDNRADGDLVASSDGRGNNPPRSISGNGTWKVDDNGAYCVQIRWTTLTEAWCRYVYKAADKYYTFLTQDDTARAWEFQISK